MFWLDRPRMLWQKSAQNWKMSTSNEKNILATLHWWGPKGQKQLKRFSACAVALFPSQSSLYCVYCSTNLPVTKLSCLKFSSPYPFPPFSPPLPFFVFSYCVYGWWLALPHTHPLWQAMVPDLPLCSPLSYSALLKNFRLFSLMWPNIASKIDLKNYLLELMIQ